MDGQFSVAFRGICIGDSPAAVVTITSVKGSTPRKPGAKMIILPDGQTFGTIGGGCGEAEVRREALNVLENQKPQKYFLNMTNEMAEEEGMVCGGIMEVFIDYLGADAKEEKDLLAAYLSAVEEGTEPVLVTIIHVDKTKNEETTNKLNMVSVGNKYILSVDGLELGNLGSEDMNKISRQWINQVRLEGKTTLLNLNADLTISDKNTEPAYQLVFEPNPTSVELLILGAGHIALPLATMGKILGYHVTVVDDRPTFANTARFPKADRVICDDFVRAIEEVDINPRTFVVIVTRGHRHDKVCLRQVIKYPASYIGMIGSRRRVKALLADLQEEGIPTERLNTIHSPIGLDIGAETPEEIAVSILAELISKYRGGKLQSLKLTSNDSKEYLEVFYGLPRTEKNIFN